MSDRPTIYVASPMTTYETSRYDEMLAAVLDRFPDARVIPARAHWDDSAHWRRGWPQLLDRLDAVVAFTEPDGIIGCGTYDEIRDARRAGLDVFVMQTPQRWWSVAQVAIRRVPASELSFRRFARVRFPRPARVYVTGPLTAPVERHDRIVRAVRVLRSDADIIEGRHYWSRQSDWRMLGPSFVCGVDALVAYTSPDGTIGSGVAREIRAADAAGVEVLVASSARRIVPLADVEITPICGRRFAPQRAARVRFLRIGSLAA